MVCNTSGSIYNTTCAIGLLFSISACHTEPTSMPTETLVAETVEMDAAYQHIYDTEGIVNPDQNQQRVRILLWLKRMNCNVSQLQKLDELRKIAQEQQTQLMDIERKQAQHIQELYTPIYNQLWDQLRAGANLEDAPVQHLIEQLSTIQEEERSKPALNARLESIKTILSAEETFLHSLSPEQESTIVDALYFLRYQLDPIGNPKDFSLLIGNTFEPGQYAILLKGTSELAQQSGNIGGLWSDQPELTGRVLHEAQREVVLYLALLEPSLEEAIRSAIALQSQSATP